VLLSDFTSVENRSNCLSRRWVWYATIYFVWLAIAFLAPGNLRGDALEDSIRQLGRRVAGVTRGNVAVIREENKSDLREMQANELTKSFADELTRNGIRIAARESQTKITITISENASGYVGVARVQRGEETQELMQFLGRKSADAQSQANSRMTLRREPLFSSAEPMLDVGSPSNESESLVVLRPEELDFYELDAKGWKISSKTELPRKAKSGRELNGRISFGVDDMTVLFPQETCSLAMHSPDSCQLKRSPENLSQVSDETLEEDKIPAGVEAIKLVDGSQVTVIVAGRDGRLRFYHDDAKAFLTVAEFGDKFTSIKGGCGEAQQVLVTGRGDQAVSDTVQVLEIHDDTFDLVAPAMTFPGPVTVLRPASRTMGIPSAAAVAVVRNLESGNYEAYRLTISCGN
jgi:hypothetical protein